MWKAPVLSLRPRPKEILEQPCQLPRRTERSPSTSATDFTVQRQAYPIPKRVGLTHRQAAHWRRRWRKAQEKRVAIEKAKPNELARGIKEVPGDLPRSGAKPTFSAEACEAPLESGLPLSHWTLETLKQRSHKTP